MAEGVPSAIYLWSKALADLPVWSAVQAGSNIVRLIL